MIELLKEIGSAPVICLTVLMCVAMVCIVAVYGIWKTKGKVEVIKGPLCVRVGNEKQ